VNETERFLDAVQGGKSEEVARLLDADPSLVDAQRGGVPAVRIAVYHRCPEVAALLVERGARIDVFDASATGSTERLRALLSEEPSRATAFAPDGFTPLGFASFFAHPAAARLLLENGADPNQAARNGTRVSPLHSAVAGGNVGIVQELLARGADVHAHQEGGFTPLHSAAGEGSEEIVRLLLAHGADGSARSDAGKTPADLARERGHDRITELLAGPG
jgi:ankyrin repeat protein